MFIKENIGNFKTLHNTSISKDLDFVDDVCFLFRRFYKYEVEVQGLRQVAGKVIYSINTKTKVSKQPSRFSLSKYKTWDDFKSFTT